MVIKDQSTKEGRQLTHAKLMISVFSDAAGQNSACTWKSCPPHIGLNSWVFAPRCLTALARLALLPLQVLTVLSANQPIFWSRQVSCRSLFMAVIHSVAFPYPPHSFTSTSSYSSLCNGRRLPASPHPSPQQDAEELWRPHRLTSPRAPLGSLTQALHSQGEHPLERNVLSKDILQSHNPTT